MSHITKEEYLSAFLDGEAGSFEQQRLCDQLESDDVMRNKLSSYALIGEVVRSQSQSETLLVGESFLAGIQDAIAEDEVLPEQPVAEEAAVVIPAKVSRPSLFPKQIVGYAVAASVAAIATMSLQNYFKHEASQPMQTAVMVPADSVPVSADASVVNAALGIQPVKPVMPQQRSVEPVVYSAPDAATRDMLNRYIEHHLQYASSSTLMPGVRAVSYSTDYASANNAALSGGGVRTVNFSTDF